MQKRKIVILGSTENIGRELLTTLSEQKINVNQIVALDVKEMEHKMMSYGDNSTIGVQYFENYDFDKTDIVLLASFSKSFNQAVKKALKNNLTVIDVVSSLLEEDENFENLVSDSNLEKLVDLNKNCLILTPLPLAIQIARVLKPLNVAAKIKRVVVSTYQSVSDAGKNAMDELYEHTKSIYRNEHLPSEYFEKTICFNVLPQIGEALEEGMYKEEFLLSKQIESIFNSKFGVSATCVRVPVFVSHCASINIEFEKNITSEQVKELLSSTKMVSVEDSYKEYKYITPKDCVLQNEVFVSRIRNDTTVKSGINLWLAADNLKLSAINAVMIIENLLA